MANNLVFQEIFDGGNNGDNSGGGGESVELDTTLTQQGKAADAKATGDAIALVNKKCDAIIGHFSAGLAYTLKDDGTYEVSGIGTCTDTDIIIPSVVDGKRVTSIGDSALYNCDTLTSITIPDGVTSIGGYAFYSCNGLESITIPDGLTSIGNFAFNKCNSLNSINIPDSVKDIGDTAFSDCSSLKSINIPNGVTSIPFRSFYDCSSLKSVTIGNRVTSIDTMAFRGCSSLESINIPDSVKSIGGYAFYGCSSLESINIPDSVKDIGREAFNFCSRLKIYCETQTKPNAWSSDWNIYLCPVIWGAALDFPSVNIQLNDCAKKEDIKDFATEGYVDAEIADAFYKIKASAVMTSVTYSELKTLRNNSELIPGMFYRITDYVCTTSQADTRAMDNKFDIIVQALSTSTLSENASADYHWVEGVVEGVTLKPSVVSDDTMLVEGSVIPFYYEYIDIADLESPAEYKQTDVFIAYGYLENNNGITVPVIYKTDESGLMDEPNPEFEEPDYADVFYYEGTANIDGVTYDKWRKIEQEEESELTWDSVGKAYLYTNIITDVPEGETTVKNVDGIQPNIADIPAWEIKYCLDNDTTRFAWAANIIGGFYTVQLPPHSNVAVKLYRNSDFDNTSGDDNAIYAWVSEDETRIAYTSEDLGSLEDSSPICWFEDGQMVGYSQIGELFEAEKNIGKGVIYYMKDEHGNECPYDFKNIQFKRMISLENGYPELDEENGDETWVYTFCGNSYHIDNDEWSELKDGSLESPYMHQSDEGGSTFHHNIIRPYIKVYDDANEDYLQCGKIYLNNNVFFGYWDEIGTDSGNECPYYSGFCCFNNTFGENCFNNTFGYSCNDNTFGENCFNNTFGNYCVGNMFGSDCYWNTFGENCSNNTFGWGCNYNTFTGGCTFNTLGHLSCSNTFGNWCYSNTVWNDCYYNTLGNDCHYNTFGNNCSSITINGDNVKYIEVGAGINSVQITPEPNANYQQIYRKSGSKEILI